MSSGDKIGSEEKHSPSSQTTDEQYSRFGIVKEAGLTNLSIAVLPFSEWKAHNKFRQFLEMSDEELRNIVKQGMERWTSPGNETTMQLMAVAAASRDIREILGNRTDQQSSEHRKIGGCNSSNADASYRASLPKLMDIKINIQSTSFGDGVFGPMNIGWRMDPNTSFAANGKKPTDVWRQ